MPARNLWDGPGDGVLFLTDRTVYWSAFLGQGRRTRPMFAQDLQDCPSARVGERGTLDVAVSGEDIGTFASFAAAPGTGDSFIRFCQNFARALEKSKDGPPAAERSPS